MASLLAPTLATVASVVGADRRTHTAQLLSLGDGKVTVSASFDGLLARPRWSPDGHILAVLATVHPHKESGAANPGAARVGDIDQAPDERRIAVLDGPTVRVVSPPELRLRIRLDPGRPRLRGQRCAGRWRQQLVGGEA